jgi:hypothetical protein
MSETPNKLLNDEVFGPQLQITGTSWIILLVVKGPHGSPQYTYVTLRAETGITILDNVDLLLLLLVKETQIILTITLEFAVLILCSFTFILPTLAVYRLSLSDLIS